MTLNEAMTNLANQYRAKEAFSYKLGLNDMAYLLSVNNLTPVPGLNLLRNTDPADSTVFNKSFGTDRWTIQSGGNGYPTVINLDSAFKAKHGFQINKNYVGNRDLCQLLLLPKGTFTFSMKAKCSTADTKKATALIRIFEDNNICYLDKEFTNTTSTSWQKFQVTFDSSNFNDKVHLRIQIGFNGKGSFAMAEPMLEVGNTAHDWTPCPIDKSTN